MLCIALALVFLGAFASSPLMASAGLVFLFFCSLLMLEGHILIPTGVTTELYIYGDNYDGYHYDDYNGTTKVSDLNIFHKNETVEFAPWDDGNNDFLGFVLLITSIVLMFSLVAGLQDD